MRSSSSSSAHASAKHDHTKCISAALDTAEQLCVVRGVQLTPIRLQVLKLIWESHQAVKAYELLDRLKPLKQEAKPATVYRALDFLIEQGLIHRIESLNAFIGCHYSGQQHEQLLLICKECHEVEERSAPAVMDALSSEIDQAGFIAHSKAIEIHGICAKCSKETDAQG
ncbi:transcriptional repressor [Methylomicrobium sp. RS1]|jgi:Fur family zinc uptake transcriptional regulator|uniref:transcriptional repressor n=1 Tax=Candidatus Methylomicrobium oryzae TaxID=2802053 RepID=UPI001924FF6D|nr:transcriptional repressor [Methylomicrobium sp. RS1]MBL1262855.1 transcriptional repressor [Methylomicrobium sp. RS1]